MHLDACAALNSSFRASAQSASSSSLAIDREPCSFRSARQVSGRTVRQPELAAALPFVPASLLARSLPVLEELQQGARYAIASECGAALFVDVAGFSQLARSFARTDASHGAEKARRSPTRRAPGRRARGPPRARASNPFRNFADRVLLFLGDALVAFVPATGPLALRDAARLAVEAAIDIRSIAFERNGVALRSHTGCGAGELQTYLVRAGERAGQLLFAGDLIAQACRPVTAAQRASKDEEIIVSSELFALLEGYNAERISPVAGRSLYNLSIPRSRPPRQDSFPLEFQATGAPGVCGCGAPLRASAKAEAAALIPFAAEVAPFVPADAIGRTKEASLLSDDIRRIVVLFASFPELDLAKSDGKRSDGATQHAARFAQVVRSVHRATAEYEGSVNKIIIDEKGASALISFGVSQFSHEDNDERAVLLALTLQEWFATSSAPFACGVAAGRSFCGSLGAPCRKEYAVIGDCVRFANLRWKMVQV
eukprot:tig00000137_g8131.t1